MDNDIIIGNELAPVPYDLFVKVIRPPLVAFDVLMVKMGVGNNPEFHAGYGSTGCLRMAR